MKTDRIKGAFLGLALGDAFGAPYEGGPLERAVWALIGKRNGKRRWTDDTQMSIDVAESFVAVKRIDPDDLARRFARSYRWSRGYGPGAAKLLKQVRRGQPWQTASRSVYPGGSYGNGGAMRAPLVGLIFCTAPEEVLVESACAATEITHAHPLAREGAVLIALATALAYADVSTPDLMGRLLRRAEAPAFTRRLRAANIWLQSEREADHRTVAAELGRGVAAAESCVTAIYLSLAFRSRAFDELLSYSIALGGDVDTLAAMSCAIWGASNGAEKLPREKLDRLEQRDRLETLAEALATAIGESARPPSA